MAEVLEKAPRYAAAAEVLAYHFARSDWPERAVAYLEQAGDQARAQQGARSRGGFYREAVERLDRLGQPAGCRAGAREAGALLRTVRA